MRFMSVAISIYPKTHTRSKAELKVYLFRFKIQSDLIFNDNDEYGRSVIIMFKSEFYFSISRFTALERWKTVYIQFSIWSKWRIDSLRKISANRKQQRFVRTRWMLVHWTVKYIHYTMWIVIRNPYRLTDYWFVNGWMT